MTRKTLGLTGTRKKDPKPVATETEAKVEVESEADPQKRFLNAVAINPAPGIRLELGSEQMSDPRRSLISGVASRLRYTLLLRMKAMLITFALPMNFLISLANKRARVTTL